MLRVRWFTLWLGLLNPVVPVLAQSTTPIDYSRDVKPILSRYCFACHGPDDEHRSAGLRLDDRDAALKGTKKGPAIVPGKPDKSRLLIRVLEEDAEDRMPPPETKNRLTKEQIAILKAWIEQDAVYQQHWAFLKPVRPQLPSVKQREWTQNPIDYFILAELEKAGIAPAAMADKYLLLRRASLDLRGLPPTPQEIDTFARDDSPTAYEKMIDTFLTDSAFGERWARMWLDLARYADSAGYGSDPLRLNIWPYRDWLIDAFNRNLPYDQFTIEQLAGDLLPDATPQQKIATAFHRNTMTNTEGGTDDEEFRVAAVKDRVDTTMQVWMGLTMGCAKCHNHKYDPITQKEYYRFYAIFNQTADNDRPDESPTFPYTASSQRDAFEKAEARLKELREQLARDNPQLLKEQKEWEASVRPRLQASKLMLDSRKSDKGRLILQGKSPAQTVTGLQLLVPAGKNPKDQPPLIHRVGFRIGAKGKPPAGRFIRVELPGPNKMLSLAEVQVFRSGSNIAPKGKASQSSTDYGGEAKRAIDGNTDGAYMRSNSVTHTAAEKDPWWEVKLADTGAIERIVIWNREDGVGKRLANFRVLVLDDARKVVWSKDVVESPAPSKELQLDGPQELIFTDAYADASQPGRTPEKLLVAKSDGKSGWSPPVDAKEATGLYLLLGKPMTFSADASITITVELTGGSDETIEVAMLTAPIPAARSGIPMPVRTALDIAESARTPEQRTAISNHFRTLAPSLKPIRDEIARLEKTKPQSVMVPILKELPAAQKRKTRIMLKGDFLNPGEEVQPGLPVAFRGSFPDATADRLTVAKWIVSPDNPLTARVAVNRFWAQLFGKGLVDTEEDFGTQGDFPTHPELLDWLATEFVRLKWDTKALLKLIVMSATYRQSSRVTAEHLQKDPKNRLYSRAPRFRLEAEMVRDQALLVSGLLSRKIGGPSVYPPQPSGLWQAAFNGQRNWPTSTGEDKYRRGLYTFWRRTVPYPSMATFDAPSRETCSVKRVRTNTPLQAFVTLNDPVYVEAAQALARRMVKEGGATLDERLRYGLKLCLCRPPVDAQVTPLRELYEKELERFRKDPAAAKAMATDPLGPLPQGMNEAELAALTVLANVLLNLDAVLVKS